MSLSCRLLLASIFLKGTCLQKLHQLNLTDWKGGWINEIPEKKDLSFLTFESVKFNFFSVKRSPQNSQVLMTFKQRFVHSHIDPLRSKLTCQQLSTVAASTSFTPLECSILTQKLMAPFFEARYECFSIKCLMSRPSKERNRLLSRLEICRNFCSTHFFQNVVTNSADSTFVDFKYFSVSSLRATSAWWGYPNTTPLVDVAKPGKW